MPRTGCFLLVMPSTKLGVMNMEQSCVIEPNPRGELAQCGRRWAVLLLHGFTSSPQAIRPWAHALADAGAYVATPFLPGHGTSVQDLAATRAEGWRTDVQRRLDQLLNADFSHVAVAGLSMGGTLALDAAAHRPVDAALVVNPALSFRVVDQLGVALSPLLQHVVPTVGPLAGDIHQADAVEVAYERTPVAAVEQLARLISTTRRQLHKIACPVTVYQSPQDHIVPASSVRIAQERIRPVLLRTVTLHNSYHVATLDFDAASLERDSVRTLRALSGAHRASV